MPKGKVEARLTKSATDGRNALPALEISALDPVDETAVSGSGFRKQEMYSFQRIGPALNELIEKEAKGELEVVLRLAEKLVKFFVRRSISRIVWACRTADVPTIAEHYDTFCGKLPKLDPETELAISQNHLAKAKVCGAIRIGLELRPRLLKAGKGNTEVTIELGGRPIVFRRRESACIALWACRKSDAPHVIRSCDGTLGEIPTVSDSSDLVISLHGLTEKQVTSAHRLAPTLNRLISAKAKHKRQATLKIDGTSVIFTLKKIGTSPVWTCPNEALTAIRRKFRSYPAVNVASELVISPDAFKAANLSGGDKVSPKLNTLLNRKSKRGTEVTLRLGDVEISFSRRHNHGKSVWVCDPKKGAAIAEHYGFFPQVDPQNEVALTNNGLREAKIRGFCKICPALQAKLDKAAGKQNNHSLRIGEQDVTFFRRMVHSAAIWAFARSDIAHVAAYRKRPPFPDEEKELAISLTGLESIGVGAGARIAKSLNQAIDRVANDSDTAALVLAGRSISFHRRACGVSAEVWVCAKEHAWDIARNYGVLLHSNSDRHHGVSEKEFLALGIKSPARVAAELNLMIERAAKGGHRVKLAVGGREVTFSRRYKASRPVWTFHKMASPFITAHFASHPQINLAGEIAVSIPGLSEAKMPGAQRIGPVLRALIDSEAKGKNEIIVLLGGEEISFAKRLRGTSTVWACPRTGLSAIGRHFNVEWDEQTEGLLQLPSVVDAAALLGSDPMRLSTYLQFVLPHVSSDIRRRVAVRALRGLGGAVEAEVFPNFTTSLAPVTVQEPAALECSTKDSSVLVRGTAPHGSETVEVRGDYSFSVNVAADGSFSVRLPLRRTAELHTFSLFAVNRRSEVRGLEVELKVLQEGVARPTDTVYQELLLLRTDLAERLRSDPFLRSKFNWAFETSFLKLFTRDEEAGFAELARRQAAAINTTQRQALEEVERLFRQIVSTPVQTKIPLLFFQKYILFKCAGLAASERRGVLLALEQGLGKTAIALALSVLEELTVIAPNAVVTAWQREARRFLREPKLEVLEGPHSSREARLSESRPMQLVTNVEFTRTDSESRLQKLSRPKGILVVDEADYLGAARSQQAIGTRQLTARFSILLSGTPFRRYTQIGNVLRMFNPDDARFASQASFARAFPQADPATYPQLHALMEEYMFRLRAQDVFDFCEPGDSVDEMRHKLPSMRMLTPDETGHGVFELSEAQCNSIRKLLTNYREWCSQHRGHFLTERDLRYKQARAGFFSRREALRQIMNSPEYIGITGAPSPKMEAMKKIVDLEMAKPDSKVIIFCRYREQVERYARQFASYGVCRYYGGLPTDSEGFALDAAGRRMRYVIDTAGVPRESSLSDAVQLRALDVEEMRFQNDPSQRIIIATHDAGGVGVTFSAAHAMIFDDLGATARDESQMLKRAHRIDLSRPKPEVRYYWMHARYPQSVLDSMPPVIRERYFDMGSYDQVHAQMLRQQSLEFHRIMDGVGDDAELVSLHVKLKQMMPFLFLTEAEAEEFARHEEAVLLGDEIEEDDEPDSLPT